MPLWYDFQLRNRSVGSPQVALFKSDSSVEEVPFCASILVLVSEGILLQG